LDFNCRHWLMPEDRMSWPQDDLSESLGRTCPGGDSTFCKGITLLRERGRGEGGCCGKRSGLCPKRSAAHPGSSLESVLISRDIRQRDLQGGNWMVASG
jgi:hypothetical protein